MSEQIEIRNETDNPQLVSACRSKLSGRLFVHVGPSHGRQEKCNPHDYVIVDVQEVDG